MMNEPRPEPPLTDIEFSAWVGQAERGDWLEYYRGFLGIDMSAISSLPKAERRQLRALANIARRAFEMGLVHLVQVRLGNNSFAYLAVAQAKKRKTFHNRTSSVCDGNSAPPACGFGLPKKIALDGRLILNAPIAEPCIVHRALNERTQKGGEPNCATASTLLATVSSRLATTATSSEVSP